MVVLGGALAARLRHLHQAVHRFALGPAVWSRVAYVTEDMYGVSIMMRIQVHLTESQNRKLRALAKSRSVNRAELIRRAIDLLLSQGDSNRDALVDLVGAAGPGPSADVSERHDAYIYPVHHEPAPMAAEPTPDNWR